MSKKVKAFVIFLIVITVAILIGIIVEGVWRVTGLYGQLLELGYNEQTSIAILCAGVTASIILCVVVGIYARRRLDRRLGNEK